MCDFAGTAGVYDDLVWYFKCKSFLVSFSPFPSSRTIPNQTRLPHTPALVQVQMGRRLWRVYVYHHLITTIISTSTRSTMQPLTRKDISQEMTRGKKLSLYLGARKCLSFCIQASSFTSSSELGKPSLSIHDIFSDLLLLLKDFTSPGVNPPGRFRSYNKFHQNCWLECVVANTKTHTGFTDA
jgi:hypothetical protein